MTESILQIKDLKKSFGDNQFKSIFTNGEVHYSRLVFGYPMAQ